MTGIMRFCSSVKSDKRREAMKIGGEVQVLPPERRVGDGSVTLRGKPSDKAKTGTWRAAAFLYVLACGNSVILMGIQGNLMPYAVNYLRLDYATAATLSSNLGGTALLLPVFWGFLADAYFGPFWIIVIACGIYAAGLMTLVLSVALPSLKPIPCDASVCPPSPQHVISVFEAAIFITCAGTAAIKPTMVSLGQQQFDETDHVEKRRGSIFFSLYYAVYNGSFLLASTFFFWIQTDIGYTQGYSAMAGFFFVCAAIFFSGTPFLRHQRPTGSPLTTLAQVVVAAVRNRSKMLPPDASELYEITGETTKLNIRRIRKIAHTDRLRFLDKAAIVPLLSSGAPGVDDKDQLKGTWNNWRLCTVTQVEVLKVVVQMIPIWFCSGMLYLMAAQEYTFFVQQSAGMDRALGPNFEIPPATITSLTMIGAVMFTAVYEICLVPILKERTGHPRGLPPLIRIGLALFLAAIVMVVAALVENRRVQTIRDHNLTELEIKQGLIPMSAFWLTPQLVLSGICNPLIGTAQMELFYQEAPETMISLAMALTFAGSSVGRFVSSAIVDLVKRFTGHGSDESWLTSEFNTGGLTKFFWLIAVIMGVNFVAYVVAAHFYSYKKLKDQQLISSLNRAKSPEHAGSLEKGGNS